MKNIDKKNTILYLTYAPVLGGADLSLLEHVRTLDKGKFTVLCVGNSLLRSKIEHIPGVRFIEMQFFLLFRLHPKVLYDYLQMVLFLVKVIRANKVDIIHTNSVKAHYIGSLASLITRKKLIWWIRDTTFNTSLYRLLHHIPIRIISVSNFTRNFFIPEKKNIIVFNGSNIYKKKYLPSEITQLKKKLGVENRFVIGTVERLVKGKGVQDLIEAFSSIVKTEPHCVLIVVGSGKNQRDDVELQLKEQVAHYGIEANVLFLGWRSDVDKLIRVFDVLVHPVKDTEAFGLVVLEAMMSQVLVVCSDVGGPKEFIEHGKTGFLFQEGNIKQLEGTVQRIITGDVQKQKIIQAASSYALGNFTQEIETRKVEDIYSSVLEHGI